MTATGINLLGEALLYVLDSMSFLAVLFAVYSSRLAYSKEEWIKRREYLSNWPKFYFGAVLFLGLLIGAGMLWHKLVDQSLYNAVYAVLCAFFLLAAVYFLFLREHVSEATRYAMILWGASGLLIAFLIAMVAFSNTHFGLKLAKENELKFEQIINLFNTFGQIGGIVVAAAMVVVTNRANSRQSVKSARSEIYQALELASIEFFRFECRETNFVTALYFPERLEQALKDDPVFDHQFRQYLYQNLNLFEMACRFRQEDVMEASIFGSWVTWIWNLSSNPVFIHHWQRDDGDMSLNYVGDLYDLIENGIAISQDPAIPAKEKEGAFFRKAAHLVEKDIEGGCSAILAFHARLEKQKAKNAGEKADEAALTPARN